MSNIKMSLDRTDIEAIERIVAEYRATLKDTLGEEHIKTGNYINFLRLVAKSLDDSDKLVSDGIITRTEVTTYGIYRKR